MSVRLASWDWWDPKSSSHTDPCTPQLSCASVVGQREPLAQHGLLFQGQQTPRRSFYAGARSRRLGTQESMSLTCHPPGLMG
jgi:hypothetical protein